MNGFDYNESANTWDDLIFRLRSVEMVKSDSSHSHMQQLVFSYSLVMVTGGEVQLVLEQDPIELDRHSIYIGKPNQTYGIAAASEGLEMYIIQFDVFQQMKDDRDSLRPIKDAQLFHHSGKLTVNPSEWMTGKGEELYRRWNGTEQLARFRCQIEFQDMLYSINKHSRAGSRNSLSVLASVKQHIEEHYTDALTIEQLAHKAELSPKYFVHLFKQRYGRSAMEYVSELRLKEAKRLMAQSSSKLREIANRVGYADEFYFSRKFKKEIGVSPTAYMNSRRRKLAVYRSELIGQLVALNIMPYAAPLHPKWTETYYRDYRHEIPVQISAYRHHQEWQTNIDTLRQSSADLILTTDDIMETERQQLEQIAPVLYVSHAAMNWREEFLQLAELLGESWQASKWLDSYENQAQALRQQLQLALGEQTFVGLRMVNDQLYLHCNRGMANVIFRDLGLSPAYSSQADTYDEEVDLDRLHKLKADHILMLIRQDSETLSVWMRLQNNPKWRELTAHTQVHLLSSDPWREYSAHAHLRMLEQAGQLLQSVDRP